MGAAESFTLACMQGGVLVSKPFISTGLKKKNRLVELVANSHIHPAVVACIILKCSSLHILAMMVHPRSTAAVEVEDSLLSPDVYSLHHQPQTHNKSSPRKTKPKTLLGFYNLQT